MPLLFVHGVSNRAGTEYDTARGTRERLFAATLLAGPDPKRAPYPAERIFDAFWGDLGAPVEAGLRSLHQGEYVAFGSEDEAGADPAALATLGDDFLAVLGGAAPADAVDLLVLGTLAHLEATRQEAPPELAAFAARAAAHADATDAAGRPLAGSTNEQIVAALLDAVEAAYPADDTGFAEFGGGRLDSLLQAGLDHLAGLVSRTGQAAASAGGRARNLASRGLLTWKRTPVSDMAALFLGDVLTYLDERGSPDDPGPIPLRIAEHLERAFAARTAEDPLIVVGHSLGGVILYDLLTGFQPVRPLVPGLEIDILVTVGSQVGVFAELGRFVIQRGTRGLARGAHLPRPPRVQRWLNVFDRTDALSFPACKVFDDVEDYDFSARTGVFSAHSAYFKARSTFYERLRARLRESPAGSSCGRPREVTA